MQLSKLSDCFCRLTPAVGGVLLQFAYCMLFCLLLPGLVIGQEAIRNEQPEAAALAPTVSAHAVLNALFTRDWQFRLQEFPQLASWVGENQGADRLNAVGEADQRRRYQFWQGLLQELERIPFDQLARTDQVNATIFRRQLNSFVSDFEFKAYLIPFTSDEGFHTELARLPQTTVFQSVQDYTNYLQRLSQIPRVFQTQQNLLQQGLASGMSLPQVVLKGREHAFRTHVVSDAKESVYYDPFLQNAPLGVSSEQWADLQKQAQDVINTQIVPAYAAFSEFFVREYVVKARHSLAARKLPRGDEYYRDRVAYYTTLKLEPEDVHQIGLTEVARIQTEMEGLIQQLAFKGSFAEFLQFLRSDSQFYAQTPEQLLMHAAWIAKRADAGLPALFTQLPRQTYGVAPVPADIAPHYTGGRYVPAPIGGTEPGYYWVNTYQLESRPLYVLPALSLHEAVPGHHLQNALAAEQGEQPPFRRYDYISAYGEGWGLYAEYLGVEMGIYRTPYEHFGRLTYEMWRACRLVVDTGIHWYGWSREQALDYLASHTALSLHEVETEVDRYISWPGQALSYKMGELTIKRLRQQAEQTLGIRFDVRAFHDLILAQGSVPLPILEEQVALYIQANKDELEGTQQHGQATAAVGQATVTLGLSQ